MSAAHRADEPAYTRPLGAMRVIINIPNILTVFRMLLVPVFAVLVLKDRIYPALWVFLTAGITDALDGFIAKRFSLKTEFGANIDPLADKLLLSTAFVILAIKDFIPLWLTALVILRDAVILVGIVSLRLSGRKVEIVPSIPGKATTALQIITVLYAMLAYGRPEERFFPAVAVLTALFTLYTGFEYVMREVKVQTGV